jgi:N-methylhydantoinase B
MVDSVTAEVLRYRFQSIAEEMARTIQRTSYSDFVKETGDLSSGLVSPGGEYVSYPWDLGVPSYLGMNMASTLNRLGSVEEGDVFLCNDPYLGGALCTHLPDLQMLKPVFASRRLLCWAYACVHSSDIGGAVPASVWTKADDIVQEGIRIRPVRLYRHGQLNVDVLQILLDNCRIPELNEGDLLALKTAVDLGERRTRELLEEYGESAVAESMDEVLRSAEERARAVYRTIPDGSYIFTDYLEDDLRSPVPVRIKARATVDDGLVTLDFSGSDPQVRSAVNLVTGGTVHPFLCQALVAYVVTGDPDIPKASSILRPVQIVSQAGSVVDAQFPAAVGVRYATVLRITDTVFGALVQARARGIPACSGGMIAPIVVSVPDSTGGRRLQVVEPIIGGGGGSPMVDGMDGADGASAGYLRNTPIEVVEGSLPILVRRYGLVPDTGGAGRHRGGLAVRLSFEASLPGTLVTARGLERFELEPWGVAGGRCGTAGWCVVERADGVTEAVGKFDLVELAPGDVISIQSPSGGGYGDPLQRSVEDVTGDIRAGLVTWGKALAEYGVDTSGGVATRAGAPQADATDDAIELDFGPGRARLESRWPEWVQDQVLDLARDLTPSMRDWVKHRMYEQLTASPPASARDVTDAWLRLSAIVKPSTNARPARA